MSESLPAIEAVETVSERPRTKIWRLGFAVFYFPFIVLALWLDSVYFQKTYFDGRHITIILFIGYFGLIYYTAGKELRKLMLSLVFLSYLGELFCCEVLNMYSYKGDTIPLYVPFGHSVVYASGYILAKSNFAKKNTILFQKLFPIFYISLFAWAIIFSGDIFSLLFGVLFIWVIRRKKADILYYFIPFCAICAEFTGANFKCWTWNSLMFGVFPSGNPPVGAVFMYAAGDVLLAKLIMLWSNKKRVKPKIV